MSVAQYSRAALLDTAMNSPRAVATHDRNTWINLFAECHVVEDPIGGAPHIGGVFDSVTGERGRGALGRFFDTFIAPNDIVFKVDRDVVCDYHVVRDLTIVERELGFRYELPDGGHYQDVCPKCRRALFGLAQGALWRAYLSARETGEGG